MALPARPRELLARPLASFSLAALLLAGCTAALPDPATPDKPGHAWTDTDAELWVAHRDECTHCGAGTESPGHNLTLLYRDGSVLFATYGQGGPDRLEGVPAQEGDRRGLTFVFPDEHGAYRDELEEAFTQMDGQAPNVVRVHAVHALRLDPSEREDVLRVVEHALRNGKDFGKAGDSCSDPRRDHTCVENDATRIYAWGRPKEVTTHEERDLADRQDAGWHLLDEQMELLHGWLGVGRAA